jgi:hypothetical protein
MPNQASRQGLDDHNLCKFSSYVIKYPRKTQVYLSSFTQTFLYQENMYLRVGDVLAGLHSDPTVSYEMQARNDVLRQMLE